MTDHPPEALTLAAVAIHDADCPDRTCSGAALGHCYGLARVALEAAAPVIREAERERIRQLAIDHEAVCAHCDECREPVAFADLLTGEAS